MYPAVQKQVARQQVQRQLCGCARSLRLQWFAGGEKLERLLKRSLATGDELAWKLLHNLAVSGGVEVAGRLLMHAKGMLAMLQVCQRHGITSLQRRKYICISVYICS